MSFAKIVAGLLTKELARLPIPADDLNAGEKFVIDANRDDARKNPGGDDQGLREVYSEKDDLRNAVVPQHYVAEMGKVRLLYKTVGLGRAPLVKAKSLRDDITDRDIVVAGYASPQVIDREKHLITKEAMAKDLPRFLANPLYANAQILHSNVQIGQVLPEWTHPETGEVYKTEVDDIGLFVVIKLRTDQYRPKICDKVVEDIEAGNLKAFSISGDAPVESREHKCADGVCFWVIPEIEFYEITLAVLPGTQVQMRGGSKAVEDIQPGEHVITHRRRSRLVLQTGKVAYEGDIVAVEFDDGRVLELTPEHRVRVRDKGWVPAGELAAGDELYDGTPNRLGQTMPDSFIENWYDQHPPETRSGGGDFHTPEGKANQRRSVTSAGFREKRREIMKMRWADPDIRAAALIKLQETQEIRKGRSSTARKRLSDNLRALRQDPRFNEAMFKAMRLAPNKVERLLATRLGPLGFWYTGDGKLITKSGLVPDFHDGNGNVVELFGDYWHAGQDPNDRITRLKEDGYDCIVLWEREVRDSLDKCTARVEEWLKCPT